MKDSTANNLLQPDCIEVATEVRNHIVRGVEGYGANPEPEMLLWEQDYLRRKNEVFDEAVVIDVTPSARLWTWKDAEVARKILLWGGSLAAIAAIIWGMVQIVLFVMSVVKYIVLGLLVAVIVLGFLDALIGLAMTKGPRMPESADESSPVNIETQINVKAGSGPVNVFTNINVEK